MRTKSVSFIKTVKS